MPVTQPLTQTQVNALYQQALQTSTAPHALTLTHEVEHAGYGAMLSRLMTGLNRSFVFSANYHFTSKSPYQIEKLFTITAKQAESAFAKSKKKVWHFFQETWDVKYPMLSWKWLTKTANYKERVRAKHQFPECPSFMAALSPNISRHQWCAILAQLICGQPTPYLQSILEDKKLALGWDETALHVGIHVRRGDKDTECPYIPNQRYVDFFNDIAAQHPDRVMQIFLTSDDPDCLADFSVALPNTSILWDAEEPRFNNCNAHMIGEQPDLALQESITAAKNICLLGQCDYVIGMATAQFTWLGGLLCVFQHQLDTRRHIMIDPITHQQSHWACTYGYPLESLIS